MQRATITKRAAMMVTACGAMAGLAGGLGGCSSTAHETMMVGNRPLVGQTAVEASPAGDAGGLGFFDELEGKPLASQDDAIHAMLLLGTGTSGGTYEQRVGMAKALGYVDKGYNQPARQAVTIGEVASMATRILEGKTPATQDDAMARLVHREIAPGSARANQGLTGAQLVSMAGGVRDAMSLEGVQRVPAPTMWEVMAQVENPPTPAPVVIVEKPKPVEASAMAATPSAPKGSVGHSEPMPPEAIATGSGVSLNEIGKGEPRKPVAVVATVPPPMPPAGTTATAPVPSAGALNPMMSGMAASNIPPALQGKGRAEPLPQIPVGTVPPAIELQDPNSKPSVIGPDEKVYTPGQAKGTEGSKVNTSKPTAKPADAKKDGAKKDAPKSQPENEWTSGKPLKPKTPGTDEPK
jgi:hypothetical protein